MNRLQAIALREEFAGLVGLYDLEEFLSKHPIVALKFVRADKAEFSNDTLAPAMADRALEIVRKAIDVKVGMARATMEVKKKDPPPLSPVPDPEQSPEPAIGSAIESPADCKATIDDKGWWSCTDCGEVGAPARMRACMAVATKAARGQDTWVCDCANTNAADAEKCAYCDRTRNVRWDCKGCGLTTNMDARCSGCGREKPGNAAS